MTSQPSHDYEHSDCRRYLDSLSDYVDGALADDLCHEIEAHMTVCDNCRVVVNTLSKTVLLYKRVPQPDVPNAVKERLYKVLDIRSFMNPPANPPADDQDSSQP